jgi:hypothetical protein
VRESGNAFQGMRQSKMDSRLRGNDGQRECTFQGSYPSIKLPVFPCELPAGNRGGRWITFTIT